MHYQIDLGPWGGIFRCPHPCGGQAPKTCQWPRPQGAAPCCCAPRSPFRGRDRHPPGDSPRGCAGRPSPTGEQAGLLSPQEAPPLRGSWPQLQFPWHPPRQRLRQSPPRKAAAREERQKVIRVGSKKKLDRREVLSIIKRDERLSGLIDEAQQIMGKPLTSRGDGDHRLPIPYYGLAADFILHGHPALLLHWPGQHAVCGKNRRLLGGPGHRYPRKGGAAHPQTDRPAQQGKNQVRSAFGIGERSLIPKEEKFINTWFNDYGFDIAMIRLAYERTVEKIGKLSLPLY